MPRRAGNWPVWREFSRNKSLPQTLTRHRQQMDDLLLWSLATGICLSACLETPPGAPWGGKRPSAASSILNIFRDMPRICVLASIHLPSQCTRIGLFKQALIPQRQIPAAEVYAANTCRCGWWDDLRHLRVYRWPQPARRHCRLQVPCQ